MTQFLLKTTTLSSPEDTGVLEQLVISAVKSKSMDVLKSILDIFPSMLHAKYATECVHNEKEKEVISMLHLAAEFGSQDMVNFLVHSGLDVNETTSGNGYTVLGLAARHGRLNLVDDLLGISTTADIRSLGADPIVQAGEGGSVEIFNRLVKAGFDPMVKDKRGETSLHMALLNGQEELSLYIMDNYPTLINVNGLKDRSCLHCASASGSVTLLKHLIENGMDTRYVDKNGCTILHLACFTGQMDTAVYLIQQHKYLLHMKENYGGTALHLASEGGKIDIFKLLVDHGLSVHDRDRKMNNMLHRACGHKNYKMIEYLLQHYRDDMIEQGSDGWYPFHDAAFADDEGITRLFMQYNVDVLKLTDDEETILHISCAFANMDTTRFILEQYPQLIPLKNRYGETAMEQAVQAGAIDIVKLFRKK